jgi:hypothetical protein
MRGPRKSRWPTPAHATHAVVRIGPVACNYPQIRPSTSSVPQQHRPLTVSGPQQLRPTRFPSPSKSTRPRSPSPSKLPRDSTGRSGCGASRRTCRPARPSSLPSACADGTAGAAGWEYREHQLQQRAVAPTCTYRERATRLNQPIGLRG